MPGATQAPHTCDTEVLSDGRIDAPLLVVAEAPCAESLRQRRPFSGTQGKLFWKFASKLGLKQEDCRVLYTTCWVPTEKHPSGIMLSDCADGFEAALAASRPRVILCLGAGALRAVTGLETPIDDARGYLLSPDRCASRQVSRAVPVGVYKRGPKKGLPKLKTVKMTVPRELPETVRWVTSTISPRNVLASQYQLLPLFGADLDRAIRAASDNLSIPKLLYSTVEGPVTGQKVAIDLETIWGSTAIGRVGVASEAGVWTVPWRHDHIQTIRDCMSGSRLKIVHNAPFDLYVLAQNGIITRGPIFDTMAAYGLAYPDAFRGLERAASALFDLTQWKHLARTEPERYNATDVFLAYAMEALLRDELESSGQLHLFEKVLMPALLELVKSKVRGIQIHAAGLFLETDRDGRIHPSFQAASVHSSREACIGGLVSSGPDLSRVHQACIAPDVGMHFVRLSWALEYERWANHFTICKDCSSNLSLIVARTEKVGLTRNPYGRIRRFWWPKKQRKEIQRFLFESTLSDMIWASILPLSQMAESKGGYLAAAGRDHVLLEIPTEKMSEGIRDAAAILEKPWMELLHHRAPIRIETGNMSLGVMITHVREETEDPRRREGQA